MIGLQQLSHWMGPVSVPNVHLMTIKCCRRSWDQRHIYHMRTQLAELCLPRTIDVTAVRANVTGVVVAEMGAAHFFFLLSSDTFSTSFTQTFTGMCPTDLIVLQTELPDLWLPSWRFRDGTETSLWRAIVDSHRLRKFFPVNQHHNASSNSWSWLLFEALPINNWIL